MGIKRVKQIRKKTSNGYTSVPLGTEGYLVDMLSGIDLEKENRLGNCSAIQIKEVQGKGTFIKEWYFKPLDESSGDTEDKLIDYIEASGDETEAIQNKTMAISKLNYFLFTSISLESNGITQVNKFLWQPNRNNTSLQFIGWKDSNDNNEIKYMMTEINSQDNYIHNSFIKENGTIQTWDDFLTIYGPNGTIWSGSDSTSNVVGTGRVGSMVI